MYQMVLLLLYTCFINICTKIPFIALLFGSGRNGQNSVLSISKRKVPTGHKMLHMEIIFISVRHHSS